MPSSIIPLTVEKIVHTLIVSAIVAAITMFGTVSAMAPKLERMEKTIDRLVDQLQVVALRQAGAIGQADTVHKHLDDRLTALERKSR